MSRSEKYLPLIIALVAPAIGIVNANVSIGQVATSILFFNYLLVSIILLVIWYFNKWLILRTNNQKKRITKYLIILGANTGLIFLLSILNSIELSERIQSQIPFWLIAIRFSIIVLIFNVILRVFEAQKEKNQLEVQNLSLQAENLKFQVDTLKQQINPHFLFNSLNTLLDLVEDDKEKAAKFIRSFSSIYRTVLQSTNYDFIPLEDELSFLKEYWSLLKVRFNDAIDLSIDIDESKLTCQIPPLSLQLLVENAVKHNEASLKVPLLIEIKSSGNSLIIRNEIKHKNLVEGEKLGLQNLQQRFTLLSKPIEWKNEAGYFVVKVPLKPNE